MSSVQSVLDQVSTSDELIARNALKVMHGQATHFAQDALKYAQDTLEQGKRWSLSSHLYGAQQITCLYFSSQTKLLTSLKVPTCVSLINDVLTR